MARAKRGLACFLGAMLIASGAPGHAQVSSAPPYDEGLLRLAEVLGSVHYLRNLCGEESNQWRERMQRLLAIENPEPLRRSRLIASFNRGYRAFDSVYVSCTPQALEAIQRYMKEGEEISREITSRYAE